MIALEFKYEQLKALILSLENAKSLKEFLEIQTKLYKKAKEV